jgi:Domain of unknown function (DUF4224)
MMPADLTDDEIDTVCGGLKQNAAKIRFLQNLGVTVERKPNGRPLVNRAHYDAVRRGHFDVPRGGPAVEPRWTR